VAVKGWLREIFRSIQGEGPYVGALQIFVRTSGCSLACRYCDTPDARTRTVDCIVRKGDEGIKLENPVDTDRVLGYVHSLLEGCAGIHSLSITGGEPLEQPEFLIDFLRGFRPCGLPVYLETNGLNVEAAAAVAPMVDIVSLDIKLPSLCEGGYDFFPVYERVIPLLGGRNMFCKVVLADGFDHEEFTAAVRMISGYNRSTRFIIQPASPGGSCLPVDGGCLIDCLNEASEHLEYVRVIPQCHRVLDLP